MTTAHAHKTNEDQLSNGKKPLKKLGDQVQYEAAPQAKRPVEWRLSYSSFWFTGIGNKCS